MLDLLVIQLTPFCNINCKYCYLNNRSDTSLISLTTINRIIDRLLEDKLVPPSLSIVFHAGEPLVFKPKLFGQVLTTFLARLPKTSLSYSIQTNGTLITQEWCDLFRAFNIQIGISIDGPELINDANRKTRNDKGTFHHIIRGINLLRENAIPYHAIAVVSASSLGHAEEMFDFFHSQGFYQLGLNIEEMEGVHESSSLFNVDTETAIIGFFRTMYKCYLKSDRKMPIREFENALGCILRDPVIKDIRRSKLESHQIVAFSIISTDCQGNFSTFSPELIGQKNKKYSDFILGNVYESGFLKNNNKQLLECLKTEINAGVEICRQNCAYYHVCGGGAPANKLYENKAFDSGETKYCKYSIQTPVDIVLESLEEMVSNK